VLSRDSNTEPGDGPAAAFEREGGVVSGRIALLLSRERDSASGGTAFGPLATASDDTQKRPDDF
jgi:hypothetical protein